MKNPAYEVDVMLSTELIKQLLHQVDAMTSLVLVGKLSRFRESGLYGVVREEIPVENDVYGASHGRLFIPLTGKNKYLIKKEVLPAIGIRTLIEDVMLERYGRLLFEATDHFKDGARMNVWFKPEFMESLQNDGIVRIRQTLPLLTPTAKRTWISATGSRFVMG
ncbi:MAG: hypothetical protein GY943_23940 [Chloroflexi bacterium]|nr:hypothetical protein [Chloroflexota bacterium]